MIFGQSPFQQLVCKIVLRHRRANSMATIVQIGANDGRINDPIYRLMNRFRADTRILLIEPQDDVVVHLKQSYQFHRHARIWNGAIGPAHSIRLYRLKPEYHACFTRRYLEDSPAYRVPTGFTSASHDHVLQHVTGNLPAGLDPADAIECITRPCSRLGPVLAAAGFAGTPPDIVQIDTEGMDDETIYASDLDVLKPSVINFEHRHLSRGRRHDLQDFLHALGYRIHRYSESDALALHVDRLSSIGIHLSRGKDAEPQG